MTILENGALKNIFFFWRRTIESIASIVNMNKQARKSPQRGFAHLRTVRTHISSILSVYGTSQEKFMSNKRGV